MTMTRLLTVLLILASLLLGAPTQAAEERFICKLKAADALLKTGQGFLHTITFMQGDAAPTAGTIVVYDNTAESGTELVNWTLTTAVFYPTTVTLDAKFSTGLYIGFTTTADVNVTVCYQ
jgi:hypothetical protein